MTIDLEKEVQKNYSYFEKRKPELLQDERYKEKFIAILNQKIVDSDVDENNLINRVWDDYFDEYKQYGDIPFYIDQVTDKEVAHFMPSVSSGREYVKEQFKKSTEEEAKARMHHVKKTIEREEKRRLQKLIK